MRPLPLLAPLAAWAPTWPAALPAAAQGQPPAATHLELHYDALLDPADPDFDETLAFLHYPAGRGPQSLGFEPDPLPVRLVARGGNSNVLVSGSPEAGATTALTNAAGIVDVVFNYPVVEPGEDYRVSADGIALLVQYLREHALELNLDPGAVVLDPRSFGVFNGASVAFGPNRADPTSPDPARRRDSRPDLFTPRIGPTALTCFSDAPGPWTQGLDVSLFPDEDFHDSTQAERQAESPIWWLLEPDLMGRERTPPVFTVFEDGGDDVCGEVTDAHSGLFGELLVEALDEYARLAADPVWRARSGHHVKAPDEDPSPLILDWTIARLAEAGDGLWLMNPSGEAGADVLLEARAAVPGHTVWFLVGDAGATPVPGCEGLSVGLTAPAVLGAATADELGRATLVAPLAAALAGSTRRYQALDLAACRASRVAAVRW